MFVCICRAVTGKRIREAIAAGASTVDEVEMHCGAGGDCGSCREEIEGIIFEEQAARCASCPHAARDTHASRAA
jgi:bacterioferritin-associated ferredoxin